MRVSTSTRGSRQLGLANYQFGRIYSRPLLGRHGKFVHFYPFRGARTTQVRSKCEFRPHRNSPEFSASSLTRRVLATASSSQRHLPSSHCRRHQGFAPKRPDSGEIDRHPCPTASKRANAPCAFREPLLTSRQLRTLIHTRVPHRPEATFSTTTSLVRWPIERTSPCRIRHSRPAPSSVASQPFFVPS